MNSSEDKFSFFLTKNMDLIDLFVSVCPYCLINLSLRKLRHKCPAWCWLLKLQLLRHRFSLLTVSVYMCQTGFTCCFFLVFVSKQLTRFWIYLSQVAIFQRFMSF